MSPLRWRRLALLLATWALMAGPAWAHKGSDAYLDLQDSAEGLQATLSVALKDLDLLLPLDADADGLVTWGEVQAATPAVLALLQQHARLEAEPAQDPACALAWRFDGLERRSDGAYLRATARSACAATARIWRYTLLREQDSNHRLLVSGQVGGQPLLATRAPQMDEPLRLQADGTAPRGAAATLRDYFMLGMLHLLEGYDHLAFLLALVLPLGLRLGRRTAAGPAEPAGTAWWSLLRTVTAFTIGHSITLVAATLGWTSASPAWVEPVIAASIAATAVLNLWPVPGLRAERLALVFGLVHGYGFAGLLSEMAAPPGLLPWALAGFNLGVEAGQLLAVSGWVLLVQAVVDRRWYQPLVVRGGSGVLILLSSWWFVERIA
ncbi:HupE/UreJ family protein [Pseudorhodoferax soli]|uniref:HupE/UreJ protein n=1 Tax=Pseudorhodoferax soli TaxID=545864 RepID=A0A368Y7Y7_9BURK|nr:HupE/UreJ family protein [Pseudorhodoferax soli]RCW76373.1 HupE/UreJ protein [Pseudorhodoferax soli]